MIGRRFLMADAASLSEFALIDRHFVRPTPGTILGPGDDCAIVAPSPGCELCITTDMLAEGTHFLPDTDPERLGWKTLAVNLSDLAAMGATPRWVLLAGCLPAADEAWIAAFARGFFALAREAGVDVIGGDTTRGPRNFCVTAIGEVPVGSAIRRDGAKVGDDLWVSGMPGRAAQGLAHLLGHTVLPEAQRSVCIAALERPQPRLALGMALRGVASAAIDVSDGLLGDLGHILERSQVGARVETSALQFLLAEVVEPQRAAALGAILAGGDDYELVFTAAPSQRRQIQNFASCLGLCVTRFGRCVARSAAAAIDLRAPDGAPMELPRMGYDHFR